MYIGYVRPVLEYAAVIWHSGLTRKQSNDIEYIQKRACKIILGHSFNSYNDELNYCNLDTLADRRLTHCLKFAENLNSNNRTSSLLPPTRLESHGRCLRNSNTITQMPFKTTRFKNSPVSFLLIFWISNFIVFK